MHDYQLLVDYMFYMNILQTQDKYMHNEVLTEATLNRMKVWKLTNKIIIMSHRWKWL